MSDRLISVSCRRVISLTILRASRLRVGALTSDVSPLPATSTSTSHQYQVTQFFQLRNTHSRFDLSKARRASRRPPRRTEWRDQSAERSPRSARYRIPPLFAPSHSLLDS